MDWIDSAVQREEVELERALALQLRAGRAVGPGRSHCIDCGHEIPEQRRALGGVTRCVHCQTVFERGNGR
ncbi:hypothetical protein D3C78_1643130 [compost metagenome]